MAKNDKKKKGEGDSDADMKKILLQDIQLLESKIHAEQEKTRMAKMELEKINKQISDQVTKLEELRQSENKKINIENEQLRGVNFNFTRQINTLDNELNEKNLEREKLEKEIQDRAIQYEKEIEEKDIANKEQQRMFDEMSQRFQSILQRTTNKLQERVNMGN